MNCKTSFFTIALIFLCVQFVSCGSNNQPVETQQLRIANVGSADIYNLTLVFPGATPTETVRVFFGDVLVGMTSEYQDVPGGVYRFAAYEYMVAGRVVNQFVATDWLGEEILVGKNLLIDYSFG